MYDDIFKAYFKSFIASGREQAVTFKGVVRLAIFLSVHSKSDIKRPIINVDIIGVSSNFVVTNPFPLI